MYLTLNAQKFSFEELKEKLGITGGFNTLTIGVPVAPGIVAEAYAYLDEDQLNTQLVLEDGSKVPVAMTFLDTQPVTFLCSRTNSYVAYVPHDVRPEAEFEGHERDPKLVVGGDKGYVVQLFRENDYIHDHGLVPADELMENIFDEK